MQLYLIRHGQSHLNLSTWTEGNTDTGLTELGRQQAAAVAGWVARSLPVVHAVYTSTMRRALETAALVTAAAKQVAILDTRLREIGANRHDHRAWSPEAQPRWFAIYARSARPFASATPAVDDGESWMHFRVRVGDFVEEIARSWQGKSVIAVCHGGVVDAIFDHVFNVGPWRRCEIASQNASVTHFELVAHPGRETWRLHAHNWQGHLVDVAA